MLKIKKKIYGWLDIVVYCGRALSEKALRQVSLCQVPVEASKIFMPRIKNPQSFQSLNVFWSGPRDVKPRNGSWGSSKVTYLTKNMKDIQKKCQNESINIKVISFYNWHRYCVV